MFASVSLLEGRRVSRVEEGRRVRDVDGFHFSDYQTDAVSFLIPLKLGQFNPSSIRMGFALVYVSVVLAYFGQGARLIRDGVEVLPSLFYLTIPGGVGGGLYWVLFVVAIGACRELSSSSSADFLSKSFPDSFSFLSRLLFFLHQSLHLKPSSPLFSPSLNKSVARKEILQSDVERN